MSISGVHVLWRPHDPEGSRSGDCGLSYILSIFMIPVWAQLYCGDTVCRDPSEEAPTSWFVHGFLNAYFFRLQSHPQLLFLSKSFSVIKAQLKSLLLSRKFNYSSFHSSLLSLKSWHSVSTCHKSACDISCTTSLLYLAACSVIHLSPTALLSSQRHR